VIASDIKQVNPEFCLILFGTNNSKSQFAIDEAMEDILAMAKACEENGTVPVVATIPPRGFEDPESKPEAEYNAALVKACRRNQIPVAYLFEEFQTQPERRALLATDGVHWGKGGFPIAARAWKKAMEQVTFALLDRTE
jgi:isochorismate hydrolase